MALAVVVNRVVAVIRRHVLADERPWRRLAAAAARWPCAWSALYSLRSILAPPSTAGGLRRMVLIAAPIRPSKTLRADKDTEEEIRAALAGAVDEACPPGVVVRPGCCLRRARRRRRRAKRWPRRSASPRARPAAPSRCRRVEDSPRASDGALLASVALFLAIATIVVTDRELLRGRSWLPRVYRATSCYSPS